MLTKDSLTKIPRLRRKVVNLESLGDEVTFQEFDALSRAEIATQFKEAGKSTEGQLRVLLNLVMRCVVDPDGRRVFDSIEDVAQLREPVLQDMIQHSLEINAMDGEAQERASKNSSPARKKNSRSSSA